MLEFYFRFRFSSSHHHHHDSLHQPTKICSNETTATELWRHIHFQYGGHGIANSTSCFVFGNYAELGRPKSTYGPNFSEKSIHGWDIRFVKTSVGYVGILLPGAIFRLHHRRHVSLHLPAKFRRHRTIRDKIMTSYPFSRWRLRHRNSTSGFIFRDFAQLGRSKSTCRPNFGDKSQSTA